MKLVVPKIKHEDVFWQYVRAWKDESLIPGVIKKDIDYHHQLALWEKIQIIMLELWCHV